MKTIKFEIEVDLTNKVVISAVNDLFLAIGGHAIPVTKGQDVIKAVDEATQIKTAAAEPVKETRKKVKEVPQVDVEKEKAKEALAELKEEKAAEDSEPSEELTPEPKTSKIDLATVREALGLKVGDHREAIKSKLTKLGANNVSTLSPDHYQTMYEFLTGL